MDDVVVWYKNLGETPLEALDRLRLEKPEYADQKLSYAGRLDPLAEGILLVLVGGANKRREEYLGLTKEYVFEVLFGVETESYDVLGMVIHRAEAEPLVLDDVLRMRIADLPGNFIGDRDMPYPPFSSRPVSGKPLFWWARQGKIHEITIPFRKVTIESLTLEDITSLSCATLAETVRTRIDLVKGDFRQESIKASWDRELVGRPQESFVVARFRIVCSSGTYVRTIAHQMGEMLGAGACAYSIVRRRVGAFK